MTLDEVKLMWKEDSVIDLDDLFTEAKRGGILHSRYLDIHADASRAVKKLKLKYDREASFKNNYYAGRYNVKEYEELLKSRNLEPIRVKYLKPDIQRLLDGDPDLIAILEQKIESEEIEDFTSDILKNIHNRGFAITNAIDWKKFETGNF